MSQMITLTISDEQLEHAKEIADQVHWLIEDILLEYIPLDDTKPPNEQFSDALILALCEAQLPPEQDAELSSLQEDQREGRLGEHGQQRLTELMNIYRRGIVRKAHALRVAVQRGLHEPLTF